MSGIMGDLMEAPMESNDPRKSKVNVAIRVRPFIKREIGETEKWSVTDTELVLKNDLARTFEARYIYDHVFGKETKTEQIYQEVVAPIVNKSFKGFNGTILCYGQTSSGKTHTLYGSDTDKGIISLFAEHLFEQIKTDQGFKEYIVRVGCIEIYNEKLTDLLNSENQIDIVERNGEVYPSNLEENTATNADELIEIAEAAQRNRRTAETLMNKFSSRSHTVLRVKIEIANLGAAAIDGDSSNTPACTTSILHFVDLAGSEKQSQTGAEGDRLTEAKNINKSLSSLSLVINQLSSNASIPELNEKALSRTASTDPRKEIRPRFVNFRDSKLTRLLQSTLNGEAFISLICNVTVANEAETKSTLQFAKQAKNIKVQPKQNFSSSNEFEKKINELRQLLWARDEENARLQKRLEGLEGFMKTEFKIYPHEKTPFQSTPGVDNAELRRYSLPFRDPNEKKGKPLLSVFKPPFPKLANEDGFMSAADTTLHFQQLTKNRDSEIFEKENCDKEVQTDVLNPSTEDDFDCSVPKKRKTSSGTPISTLRLTSTILRNAYETDQSEWAERLAFLEEENKCLKSLEETNDELRKEVATLSETVKELTFQKTELEKDVLRQMEASKRNCSRILQDVTKSDQYKEIEDKYKQSEAHLEAANEDIRNLKNQLQCLQEQFQIAKEDFELLKSQTEDFKSGEHEALVKNNKQSQADLEAANEAIKELKNQLQFHKEQLEKAKEDFELLESQTEDFKSEEHETLLQNHKQSQADLEAANEDIRALKNQLECLKEQLEISKEDSKLQGGNENKVSSAIQCQMGTEDVTESDQYKEIEDKYKQSEAHLEAANEDIRELKNQLECQKEQLEKAKENFELLKSQTEEFKSGEYETLLQNYKAANENIRELENQLQCHKEQLEKTKEDFELLKSQTEDFKSGEYEAVLQNHKQSQIDLEAANEDIRELKDQLECHKKQLEKTKENFKLLESQAEGKSGEYEALLQNYKQSQADLEAANENIRELKSQLQCHKEQLEKAKENFELLESQTEEFKSGEYEALLQNYKQSQADLEAANENIVEMKSQLQCHKEQLEKAKEDFELLKSQAEGKSGEYEALLLNFKHSQADLEAANENIRELKNQLQCHKEQLEKAKENFELLESQTEEFKSGEYEALLQNYKQSQADLEAANENIREMKSQLQCHKEQLEKAKEDFELLKSQAEGKSGEYEALLLNFKHSQADLEAANENIRELKNQLQCHKEQLEKAKEDFELLESQTEEFKSGEYEALLQNYKHSQADLEAANENIREMKSQLQCHKEQLEKAKEDFELLKSQAEGKSGEYEALLLNYKHSQADLEAANENIRELKNQLQFHKEQLEKAKENFKLLESQAEGKSGEYEAMLQNYKQSQADLEVANENIRELENQLQCHKEELEKTKEKLQGERGNKVNSAIQCQMGIEDVTKSDQYKEIEHKYKQAEAHLEAANEDIRELKNQLQCHKELLEKTQEMLHREKGFTVNRAIQCNMDTEDADAWKEKAKDYKLQAILFQKKLQARESEHGILQEKNARIIELESLITRKEDDIQQLQKHMLSLIPERKITQDAEVNCTLLNEQVKRTERGEKGLLPPFIPDIYKLRADLKSAKDSLANAKIQLHKCTCSGNRMETSKAGPFGGTVLNSKPSSTTSKTFTSSSAIGFRPPKSLQLSRLTAVRTTNEDHPCAHIPVTTKSAVTEHSGSNLQNAPVMNANNSIEPVAPECYRQPEPLSLQPSRLNSVRTNYGDTASPAINRHPVTESQNIPPTTAQYQEETEESDDQSMNWFYEVVAKADAKKKAKTNTNLSNQ